MTRCARVAVPAFLVLLAGPLHAQSARDSLAAGRRAYEAVDYAGATRLLPVGLVAPGPRDTAWSAGVHMLADALLELRGDSLAALWARWALRAAPRMRIDSAAFPPRVTRLLTGARAALQPSPNDSFAVTAFEPFADTARGLLRLARVPGVAFATIEGVGTILPGESRAAPPGTYAIRIMADGYPAIVASREVLPGVATIVTPRLVRIVAPAQAAAAPAATPVAPPQPPLHATTLSSSGAATCFVASGRLACWGDNTAGQLGSGAPDSVTRGPVFVSAGEPLRGVSVGAGHACGLSAVGKAWCWGLGTSGQLGNGQAVSSASPVAISGTQVFVALAAGGAHTCGLTRAATVFCWGANREGQLGNRSTTPSLVPVQAALPASAGVTAISAGYGHTCAVSSGGSAYCWGANASGQLGNGSTSDANAPVVVQSSAPMRVVRAGGSHTCALAAGGAAWCWGANGAGQAGTGSAGDNETRPVAVTGGLTFDSLDTGESHSCGLTADGAAYCWGTGRAGQLGNGQSSDSPRPVLVVGGHVFRAIATGRSHTCAADADSLVRCWGANAQGQAGMLGGRGVAIPVAVVAAPAPRVAASGLFVVTSVRERFDDGNWTAGPSWTADSASGARLAIADGVLEVRRTNARGATAALGLSLPVRIPVTRTSQVQLDVQVDSARGGCGLNCASWPALLRLRVKNSDLTESEVWYAFGDSGGAGRPLGGVTIVAKGDAPAGQWLREQRFTIRDAAPRADTIIQVWLGGIGTDFAARFDNLTLPVPVLRTIDLKPDSIVVTTTTQLRVAARDAANAEMPVPRLAWTSSDTSIARVDSLGAVTAVRNGRAYIRAVAGGVADSTRVIVRIARRRGR